MQKCVFLQPGALPEASHGLLESCKMAVCTENGVKTASFVQTKFLAALGTRWCNSGGLGSRAL